MRVAVVHDWLYTLGGAEQVLREILRCYPNADVFTLFDALSPECGWRTGPELLIMLFIALVAMGIMEYFPKVYAAYSATFGLTLSSDGVFVELSNSNLTPFQLFRDFLQIFASCQHFLDYLNVSTKFRQKLVEFSW